MNKYLVILLLSGSIYSSSSAVDSFGSVIIFPFLFALMYFLLIRPQSKKIKEHKLLIESIKINDEIIIQSGLVGKIKKISDHFLILSVDDGVDIVVQKESVLSILPKGTIKNIRI